MNIIWTSKQAYLPCRYLFSFLSLFLSFSLFLLSCDKSRLCWTWI